MRLFSDCKQLGIGIDVVLLVYLAEVRWNRNEGVWPIVWVRGNDIEWAVYALCEGVCGVTLVMVIGGVSPCHRTTP